MKNKEIITKINISLQNIILLTKLETSKINKINNFDLKNNTRSYRKDFEISGCAKSCSTLV